MSGAEAGLLVEAINDFVKQVKELGPLGKAEGLDEKGLQFKLEAVTGLIPYIRLVERETVAVAGHGGRSLPKVFRQ